MSLPSELPVTDSQRLARIEVLLEMMVKGDADHESRIRKLERWQWVAMGFAGGIGGVIGQSIQALLGGQ